MNDRTEILLKVPLNTIYYWLLNVQNQICHVYSGREHIQQNIKMTPKRGGIIQLGLTTFE